MFLFLTLLVMFLVVGLVAAVVIGATGGIGILLFAEPIICVVLIAWILKKIFKK